VERVQRNARFLREGLRELGYNTGRSETAVIPVVLGDDATTTLFAGRVRKLGIMVTPVIFPAVAQGIARLRLCVTAAHCAGDLEFALEVFRRLRDSVDQG
jgi:glycine C-acetyltransferase